MDITYEDWTECKNILAHVVSIPETNTTKKAEVSIGVRIESSSVCVVVESTLNIPGVTADLELYNQKLSSDFDGRPNAYFVRYEKSNLHEAIIECNALKAAFESKIFTLVDEDRKAFERSLSGA